MIRFSYGVNIKKKCTADGVLYTKNALFHLIIIIVAPMAPHGQFKSSPAGGMTTEPPISAARHAHLFKDVKSMYATYSTFFKYVR